LDERSAQILTEEQAEAVKNYLIAQHRVNRLGWWSSRNVLALGMGTRPPPNGAGGNKSSAPARRVEVIVFIPPEEPKPEAAVKGPMP
jgi:phospholipid/cholesterol/gamma-HCH transport system substrate-binding protein